MTASTETGVENVGGGFEGAGSNGATAEQPTTPADTGTPDSTGTGEQTSGTYQPHDGVPSPHDKPLPA